MWIDYFDSFFVFGSWFSNHEHNLGKAANKAIPYQQTQMGFKIKEEITK